MRITKDRIGEKHITNEGYEITIIEFINASDCTVEFEDGTIVKNRQYIDVKKGEIRYHFKKGIYGVGYLGKGKYKSKVGKKITTNYSLWKGVLERCYDEKYMSKHPTYRGCSVHPDWHNFQVFAEWIENNHIEGFDLDKDILIEGNKVYGPNTCCFVPSEINKLFMKRDKKRDAPIGVSYNSRENKYISQLSRYGKQLCLGKYDCKKEAFKVYKIAKEAYVKEMAEKWKGIIAENVYIAMMNYKIEITN